MEKLNTIKGLFAYIIENLYCAARAVNRPVKMTAEEKDNILYITYCYSDGNNYESVDITMACDDFWKKNIGESLILSVFYYWKVEDFAASANYLYDNVNVSLQDYTDDDE